MLADLYGHLIHLLIRVNVSVILTPSYPLAKPGFYSRGGGHYKGMDYHRHPLIYFRGGGGGGGGGFSNQGKNVNRGMEQEGDVPPPAQST